MPRSIYHPGNDHDHADYLEQEATREPAEVPCEKCDRGYVFIAELNDSITCPHCNGRTVIPNPDHD